MKTGRGTCYLIRAIPQDARMKITGDYHIHTSASDGRGGVLDKARAAAKLGLDVYLVTDYIENEKGLPIDAFPQGSLASVLAWSEALPGI